MNPRDAWQRDRSPSLRRRRRLIALGALGLVDAAVMSARQVGLLRHLPDPPLPGFDSDAVVASRAAYALGVPDAPLPALACAATMVFSSVLGGRRLRTLAALALGATVAAGAAGALFYLGDMVFRERRACAYCIPAAAIQLAMVPPAARELVDALRAR